MANFLYTEAKRAILDGEIDFGANSFRMTWHNTGTTVGSEEDTLLMNAFSTLNEFSGTGYPAAITGIQLDNPIVNKDEAGNEAEFDIDDETVSAVAAGSGEVTNVVIFKWGGTWATSVPIIHLDNGVNLPFTPDGSDITFTWNAEGIFKLT